MEAVKMFKNSEYKVCPKTGKVFKVQPHRARLKWLWPITGLFATIWFLIRVIPKPSRAEYPCQRLAFPVASSFIAYLIGIFTTAAIMKRATSHIKRAKYIVAAVCLCAAMTTAWFTIGIDAFHASATMFVPTDGNNNPMGVARGIYPGRVIWVWDPNATTWNSSLNTSTTIFYWDDSHTNQAVVDEMYSKGIRWLTNSTTDEEAWDKLFKDFNQRHGKGTVGYTSGQKIAIKPNHVEQRRLLWENNLADLAPQTVVSLLKQLVWEANVPQDCITICDSSRYISNKEYYRCHAIFPNVHYLVTNFYADKGDDRTADTNRPPVMPSDPCVVATYYSHLGATGLTIPPTAQPMPFVEADYVVNLAIMKGHSQVGATFCGKNWYGCFCAKPGSATATYPMPWNDPADTAHTTAYLTDTPTMGNYRLVVDLMGNKNFGEKTVLFILDGLWGFAKHSSQSYPQKYTFPPFTNTDPNGDYPSSLLMSQDMVAIDSVGLDFVRAQYGDNLGTANLYRGVDDYMHEAALANDPCSGTVYGYDTNGAPTPFPSLGVHEHWNDSTNKQYTRNLGTGTGIELILSGDPLACLAPPEADLTNDCIVDFSDFRKLAQEWYATPVEADISGDGYVNMLDMHTLATEWLTCGLADPNMCWPQ